MKVSWSSTGLLLLITLAAGGGYLFFSGHPHHKNKAHIEAKATISGVEVTGYDNQGHISSKLYSPEVHHFPQQKKAFLVKPRVVLYRPQEPPLVITADSADAIDNMNIIILHNNVRVDQGTTHLNATLLKLFKQPKKNSIDKALAYGSPTCYETHPKPTDPAMHACANEIQYYPERKYVILIGKAHIQQGENHLYGPRVEYDLAQNRVITKPIAGERTTMIIPPHSS